MRVNDVQLGAPQVLYKDTKANIQSMTVESGAFAYATDTSQMGYYDGSTWHWYSMPTSGTGIVGSGTANTIPKFTGANAIGNSVISENSGNVGIGTTSPLNNLQIKGTDVGTETTPDWQIRVSKNFSSSNGLGAGPGILFSHIATAEWMSILDSSNMKRAGISAPAEDTSYSRTVGLGFWTSSFDSTMSEKVRITGGGNVGIGTTSPQTKLHVNGNSAQINNTVWGWSQVHGAPASTTYYKIATLPTSNAGTYDHIVINGVFDGDWSSFNKAQFNILFGNRNGFTYKYDLYGSIVTTARIVAYQESDGSISIYTCHNAIYYTTISYNIQEAIGATVYSNPTATTSTPTGTLVFDSSSSTYGTRLLIDNNGNVGIKTTGPSARLAINGGVNVGADADPGDDNLYIVNNCSALSFTDRTKGYDGDALSEIKRIKNKNEKGEIDHDTLPEFVKKEIKLTRVKEENDEKTKEVIIEQGRDIGAMVTMLTVAMQQIADRLEKLEEKIK